MHMYCRGYTYVLYAGYVLKTSLKPIGKQEIYHRALITTGSGKGSPAYNRSPLSRHRSLLSHITDYHWVIQCHVMISAPRLESKSGEELRSSSLVWSCMSACTDGTEGARVV